MRDLYREEVAAKWKDFDGDGWKYDAVDNYANLSKEEKQLVSRMIREILSAKPAPKNWTPKARPLPKLWDL